ncbi:MAG: alcohol dehydrogenase catalytic domain-containing protein [Armatimonadetes bacterium]|nr:alcohol dehydrogenase catalytic domain-containing protein [Armatimonadota bacterium]
MRSVALTALKRFEMADAPVPEPGPGEVLVRVKAVGVCHSDVHYYKNGGIGDKRVIFPYVLGHECSGEVAALGPGVGDLTAGQRVAIEPSIPCGACEWCRKGRPNICENVQFLSTPPVPGSLQDYIVMPEGNCVPVAESVSFEAAAVAEPLSVGLHAVNLAFLRVGDTVAVFGCGPIGLAVLHAARRAGASEIYAVDPIPERLHAACRLGASRTFDPSAGDPARSILERTGGRGVDAAFEAAGEQAAVDGVVAVSRIGGRALVIGIPVEDRLSFDAHTARRKELVIVNVRRSNFTLERAVHIPFDTGTYVTHHFSLEETAEAFALVDSYEGGVIKAMIHL